MKTDIQAAVITISDKASAGEREDRSGPLLAQALEDMGAEVAHQETVPDEQGKIGKALCGLADESQVDLIISTGGTGPAPRDCTPEATSKVIDRGMPGITELLRMDGYKKTPFAVLSRGVAGIRGKTLIINLPGNPKAVSEGMDVLTPIIPHTISMIRGENLEH